MKHAVRIEAKAADTLGGARPHEPSPALRLPMLIRLLGEYQWQGYSHAQVLTELTGKYYGWDAKRWQKWWDKNKDELLASAPKNQNGGD